jgi:hypothetical protein
MHTTKRSLHVSTFALLTSLFAAACAAQPVDDAPVEETQQAQKRQDDPHACDGVSDAELIDFSATCDANGGSTECASGELLCCRPCRAGEGCSRQCFDDPKDAARPPANTSPEITPDRLSDADAGAAIDLGYNPDFDFRLDPAPPSDAPTASARGVRVTSVSECYDGCDYFGDLCKRYCGSDSDCRWRCYRFISNCRDHCVDAFLNRY